MRDDRDVYLVVIKFTNIYIQSISVLGVLVELFCIFFYKVFQVVGNS